MSGIEVGMDLPTLVETPTLRTLVQYAGASGDFYEMHYDVPFAAALGHPDLAVHGLLKTAWLGRLVQAWIAGRGRLVSLEASYRGMDFRDRPCTCGGRVVRRHGTRVELELWTADQSGRRTTVGSAEVELEGDGASCPTPDRYPEPTDPSTNLLGR